MRGILLSIAFMLALVVAAPQAAPTPALGSSTTISASASLLQEQAPPKDLNVDINVGQSGGGRWYASPVWIAIGAIAIVVVVMLIAMAVRGGGGGTTIVKD